MVVQAGPRIAYFSMEIAADPRLLTYAGGLGVLAGDTLRSTADLALPNGWRDTSSPPGIFPQATRCKGSAMSGPKCGVRKQFWSALSRLSLSGLANIQ
jgi:glucan phosphorylase